MPVTTNTRKLAALLGASGAGIGTDGLMQPAGIDADMATQAELDGVNTATQSSIDSSSAGILKNTHGLNSLAMHSAVSDNRAAFNLPNSFIDHFEDDTGVTTTTNCYRDKGLKYILPGTLSAAIDYGSGTGVTSTTYTAIGNFTSSTMTHTKATDGTSTTGAGSGAASVTGGLRVNIAGGLGHSTEFTSTVLKLGSHRTNGDPRQYRLTYSIDDQTYYPIDMSGATVTSHTATVGSTSAIINWNTSHPDNNIQMVRDAADGQLFLSGHSSNGNASINVIGGMPVFYAKYIKIILAAGDWHDGNAYLTQLDFDTVKQCSGINSTATLISDTQTSTATTKMSGAIGYKDHAGTATLGTDLKIYFSANSGTNWTEASSYGTPTAGFVADGQPALKLVSLGETTVTSGTGMVMKAVWANQSAGSKETCLDSWAMNY